ncbi:hypothetical protein [Flavihumibacter sp. UBA7668]|uniref:hypothetical protein n=1 Tax=Flavihumibacter sp. UBA7668 TaxID=1946542 RepID=UPI0025C14E6B|nr:hypothetical protein [Flavihumibacter sp. UBA7668]
MNNLIYNFWGLLVNLLSGYVFSTTIFLIGLLFFECFRKRRKQFLNKSGIFVLAIQILLLVLESVQMINQMIRSKVDSEAGVEDVDPYIGNEFFLIRIVSVFLFGFFFHQLFWWQSNRQKIWVVIISIILSYFIPIIEGIYILIAAYFSDFIQSYWSIKASPKISLQDWIIPILVFLVCWIDFKPSPKVT